MTTVQAVHYTRYGDLGEVRIGSLPAPSASPGRVLVDVRAVSVNPVDVKTVAGELAPYGESEFPALVGADFAGVVKQADPGASFSVGDEVFGSLPPFVGSFAETISADPATLAAKPTVLSWAEAASIPTAGVTALTALATIDVKAGDVVIVNGVSGGVGAFAAALLIQRGAVVIGTLSPSKITGAAGFTEVGHGPGVSDRVREALQGLPAAALVDTHGGTEVGGLVTLLADRTNAVSVAHGLVGDAAGGTNHTTAPSSAALAELAALAAAGAIRVPLSETRPIREVKAAYEDLLAGRVRGKLVLDARAW
ncbi:Acrylyl-CoA reductase AcuI [Streptomyces sp. ADI96-02]|uniref:NADP-dependent oxidoreductase n=1 Tax=Streptomyces sp. ADI96-02 TaxID=1522760 RepID=UPI000F54EE8B|nr:NADP-dependent oxidoreductase [Streptomyces sp. ADI96-02]RPK55487.1 Acrylyl-CoA reductase AcuI [Streptomyces sp. ADI96-02]